MKIDQKIWTPEKGWSPAFSGGKDESVQLVLFFGSTQIIKQAMLCYEVKQTYPNAHFCGCSTAGEIAGTQVIDNAFVLTAISFESTRIQGAQVALSQSIDSYRVGQLLAESLDTNGLRHVIVLSDGISVNGSDLVRGLTEILPAEVSITGGLAGDGDNRAVFQETPRSHVPDLAGNAVGIEAQQAPQLIDRAVVNEDVGRDPDDPHGEVGRLLASRRHHALQPGAGTGPRIFFLT
jgi:hypothetical protein